MLSNSYCVSDEKIEKALKKHGWDKTSVDEGRLMLMELLAKANAGCYNSHTEEAFMLSFGLIGKSRTLNKAGRRFLCDMVYASSNRQAAMVKLSLAHRTPPD